MIEFKTEAEYYADKKYVSNSMLSRLADNEQLFDLWMRGMHTYEPTEPMAVGNVIHNKYFEHLLGKPIPDTQTIHIIDDYDRRTKVGKAYHLEIIDEYAGEMVLKESVYLDALALVERMGEDTFLNEYIHRLKQEYSLHFEIQATGKYGELLTKGKADIVCKNINGDIKKLVDLKTTSSMGGFRGSVRKYGYNRQWLFYAKLFGLDPYTDAFDFLVVEKGSCRTAAFNTSRPAFVEESQRALDVAVADMILYQYEEMFELKTKIL